MIVHTYWAAVPVEVPADDAQAYRRDNARWCQEIDADCNDCRHFARERFEQYPGLKRWVGTCSNPARQPVHCTLGGKVVAYPAQYTGNPCFMHRKA